MSSSPPEPEVIKRLSEPIIESMTMMAGVQLDVFSQLKDGPRSASQVAEALHLDARKLGPLLYALVVVGLLTVEDGLFANTEEANHYMVRGRPGYMYTGFLIFGSTLTTAETIRTGMPQSEHDYETMSPDEAQIFCENRHPVSVETGQTFATEYDFSSCRSLIDVGGGSGGIAIAMAEAYPQLKATVVELASVTPITQRYVDRSAARDRIQVETVDVVKEPLTGSFDSAILDHFIQILSPEDARQALSNLGQAIEPGGRIYIQGHIIDDSRLTPPDAVLANMVFLNVYKTGQAYTEQEYRGWLTEAGFEDIEHVTEPESMNMILARKGG